jgi:cellulose synthase operon protein C
MDPESAHVLLAEAERSDVLAQSDVAERLAVLGTFDPERLPGGVEGREVFELLCRRLPSRHDTHEAILSDARRVEILAGILARGGKPLLAERRRSIKPHYKSPLQRMLDAFVLDDAVPVEDRDEDELLASLNVWRWMTEAVARAGLTSEVEVEPTRDLIESRLELLDVTRAVRRLAGAGCIGREAELARLHDYRSETPGAQGLADQPAMVLYGIGGVGKSTLVARFVMDLYEEAQRGERRAWAYLDLDRPTLASCEPEVVLADIVRQVGAQFPEQRRLLERGEDVLRQRVKGAGLESADAVISYREQASDFAWAMQSITDGSLVVVLDTFEQLEHNRPEQGQELYGLFATLASELPAFRLIVSGRGPAAPFVEPSRPDRRLHMLALPDDAALALLRFFVEREADVAARGKPALDDDLGREVIRLVGGIPLTVRLAARILVREGPSAIADAAARGAALHRVRSEFVRGFLYQRILDHVVAPDPQDTEDLRRVARASIVLRRMTVELIERVLLPAIDPRPSLSPSEIFDALGSEVAFAEREGEVLRVREELRGPALAALKFDDAQLVERVHELAVAYYAKAPDDETAPLELAYHRLAKGDPATDLDDTTLRRLEPSIADLPQSSALLIHRTLRNPAALPESRDHAAWERRVLPEADAAVRMGDLKKARALLAERHERSEGSELHRVESRLEEAEGNLNAATEAARRDWYACVSAGDVRRFAAAAVRLAGLHERRGAPADAAAAVQEATDAPFLAGYPELRLELLLNRMNILERAGLDTEESRWSLSLDARALMQRSNPRSISANTALVRLLAAALGREEPERLEEAVRRIGLGHEEDPERVQALVAAIAAWDAAQSEPGRLARMSGLRLDKTAPDGIELAWAAGVAGLGTDAGLMLARLWKAAPPPEPVREAIRMIYVWWGVEASPQNGGTPERPHFLDVVPLDWSRKETRELEDIMLTAYPTSTENQALADRAGVDLGKISWAGSDRRITRELLDSGSRAGRLDTLIQAVLDDKATVSVHDRLRSLVGDEWLEARGLLR